MSNELTNYCKRKVQFKTLDFLHQIAKDRLHGTPESLIVICKDLLTDSEFKMFVLEIEKNLKLKYVTKRMQMLSKYSYILKITDKLPDDC